MWYRSTYTLFKSLHYEVIGELYIHRWLSRTLSFFILARIKSLLINFAGSKLSFAKDFLNFSPSVIRLIFTCLQTFSMVLCVKGKVIHKLVELFFVLSRSVGTGNSVFLYVILHLWFSVNSIALWIVFSFMPRSVYCYKLPYCLT